MLSTLELVASVVVLIISTAFVHHFLILRSGPNDPPLVKGVWPILGCGLDLERDMKTFLLKNRAKHGGIFSIYVFGSRIHVVSDPADGIPTFFRSKNFGFNEIANTMRLKTFVNTKEEVADTVLNDRLFASLHSDLLSNEGTTELKGRLLEHMKPRIQRFMDDIGGDWKEVDFLDFCSRLVFELSNTAMMGPTFPTDQELYDDLLKFEDNFVTCFKLPEFLIKKERAHSQKLVNRMVEVYKNGIDASRIVRARMKLSIERGQEDYIPKDLLVLAWASLTNAMPTLFWYVAYIHCQNRQDEFIEEVKRCVGQSKLADLNLDNILTSNLLHAGLKETLRIQGHNISPRSLEEDTVLKIKGREYLLKKGSLAFAPSSLLNWNPAIYANPEMWKVERFLENSNDNIGTKYDGKKLKIPLLIWGAGIHACPGRRFATIEIILMLALILLYFELAPPEGQELFSLPAPPAKDQYGMGVKGPAEPYKVRLRVRKESLSRA